MAFVIIKYLHPIILMVCNYEITFMIQSSYKFHSSTSFMLNLLALWAAWSFHIDFVSPTFFLVHPLNSIHSMQMGIHGESKEDNEKKNCVLTPIVSPTGHIFNSSKFSLCVDVISELDQPVDVSHATQAIRDILLAQNPQFSCIMVSYIQLFYFLLY